MRLKACFITWLNFPGLLTWVATRIGGAPELANLDICSTATGVIGLADDCGVFYCCVCSIVRSSIVLSCWMVFNCRASYCRVFYCHLSSIVAPIVAYFSVQSSNVV